MPLDPSILKAGLMALDEGGGAKDVASAALEWTKAWKAYVAGCVYIAPGSAELMGLSFQGVISAAFAPLPVPLPFFTLLGAAMTAGWASAVPLAPAVVSFIPAVAPFAPLGLAATVAVGLASSSKDAPRAALAAAIDGWTRTIQAVGPVGPLGPVS